MKGIRYIISALAAICCLSFNAQVPTSANSCNANDKSTVTSNPVYEAINARIQFPVYGNTLDKTAISMLDSFAQKLDSVAAEDEITSIRIKGMSSPDGPEPLNVRLASDRANALFMYVFPARGISADSVDVDVVGEDWDTFRSMVAEDVSFPQSVKILDIIDAGISPESKERRLKALDGGKVWMHLCEMIFPRLRAAGVEVRFVKHAPVNVHVEFGAEDAVISDSIGCSSDMDGVGKTEFAEPSMDWQLPTGEQSGMRAAEDWVRQMSIKSNLPVWLAAMPNLAVEFDLAHHFSLAVSAYYSGWDYFKSDIKFRNLTIMPEVRYWPRRDNNGFFIGVHGGVAWYNVAWGGKYRYQDHGGNTPALGGGINLGYRFRLRSRHWSMEASVGAGTYKLDYDMFLNQPDGIQVDRRKRMYYGIDNVALSVCYSFGLSKKGGKP